VYIDCDKYLVKEVDATKITDDEAALEIYASENLQLEGRKWSPKAPSVATRRFYNSFCLGKSDGFRDAALGVVE